MDPEKQILSIDGTDMDERYRNGLLKAARFHGHICPGLAIGVVASVDFLGSEIRSADEELVAVVENDACGVDAVQSILGCTFGKGNLIFRDFGKSVYTFYNRKTGKGTRYSLKDISGVMNREGSRDLAEKVRSGDASEEESDEFQRMWSRLALDIVNEGAGIFEVTDVEDKPPDRARIFESLVCVKCREKVSAHRVVRSGIGNLCIPCSGMEWGEVP
jgi:formylmethanofuran dehydrogenase subunit E